MRCTWESKIYTSEQAYDAVASCLGCNGFTSRKQCVLAAKEDCEDYVMNQPQGMAPIIKIQSSDLEEISVYRAKVKVTVSVRLASMGDI